MRRALALSAALSCAALALACGPELLPLDDPRWRDDGHLLVSRGQSELSLETHVSLQLSGESGPCHGSLTNDTVVVIDGDESGLRGSERGYGGASCFSHENTCGVVASKRESVRIEASPRQSVDGFRSTDGELLVTTETLAPRGFTAVERLSVAAGSTLKLAWTPASDTPDGDAVAVRFDGTEETWPARGRLGGIDVDVPAEAATGGWRVGFRFVRAAAAIESCDVASCGVVVDVADQHVDISVAAR